MGDTAVITGATGDIKSFYSFSSPTIAGYAERIGAEFLEGPWETHGRGAYWMKLAALAETLQRYARVLWLDADVIVTDDAPDIFDAFPSDKWLGAVEHCTHEGFVFNVGVMAVRSCRESREFVQQAWELGSQYLSHKWPDQAPVMKLLGYSTTLPVVRERATRWSSGLERLPSEWNALPRFGQTGHFLHFAGVNTATRVQQLQKLLEAV